MGVRFQETTFIWELSGGFLCLSGHCSQTLGTIISTGIYLGAHGWELEELGLPYKLLLINVHSALPITKKICGDFPSLKAAFH